MQKFIFESVYALRNLSFKEKVTFFVLTLFFVISSVFIVWRVSGFYLMEIPALGGSLSEGIIGTPRFINPILAVSDADRDMAGLIYSGLLRPDNQGDLVTDLAEKFEISEDGLSYTFVLKPDLVWQDEEKITSDDVIFTVQQAKNPDVKSPKRAKSWQWVRAG